jgi:hypothetical protein
MIRDHPRHPRKIPALRVVAHEVFSAISAAFCKKWIDVLPAKRREYRINEKRRRKPRMDTNAHEYPESESDLPRKLRLTVW